MNNQNEEQNGVPSEPMSEITKPKGNPRMLAYGIVIIVVGILAILAGFAGGEIILYRFIHLGQASLPFGVLALLGGGYLVVQNRSSGSDGLVHLWKEWIRPIGEAVIIALVLTTFVFTTVAIDGASDEPNVHHGERVFVPKYETWLARIGIGSFKRGDLVVLKPPKDSPHSDRPVPFISNFFPNARYRPFFIKRIVGVPGDRLKMINGLLQVNGIKINETHNVGFWRSVTGSDKQPLWDNTSGLSNSKDWSFTGAKFNAAGEYEVPKGKYFVMGDNRSLGGSEDSRYFGPIALEEFAGRATFVWWSPVAKAQEIKATAASGAQGKSWWLYQHEKLNEDFLKGPFSLHFMMRPLTRPDAFDVLNK
jgi:signal peptidase I